MKNFQLGGLTEKSYKIYCLKYIDNLSAFCIMIAVFSKTKLKVYYNYNPNNFSIDAAYSALYMGGL